MAIASDVDAAVRRQVWQESAEQRLAWNSTRTPEMFHYARARAFRAEAFASFFRSLGRFLAVALQPLRQLRRQSIEAGGLGNLPRTLST